MILLLEILAVGCGPLPLLTTLFPCRETRSSVRCQSPVRDALAPYPAWSHAPVAARRAFRVACLLFSYPENGRRSIDQPC